MSRAWLAPLGGLYGLGAAARVALYRRRLLSQAHLPSPVISVGNLSVGGSGKTPVVARIAELLQDAGQPVAILSRGYRGSFRGESLIVGDGSQVLAGAAEAGDEPVMLARSLPGVVVAVGRRRDLVGKAVLQRFGPRVLVLDDGFQHLRLARDLDILCLDAADLSDRPLPAGRLREFPRAAWRADLILLSGADDRRRARCAQRLGEGRCLPIRRIPRGFFGLDGESRPAPLRPFLVAAIARPERFRADVDTLVPSLAGSAFFRDHHPFTVAEVAELDRRARSLGADALVTTAKDAVRFPSAASALPVLVLRTEARAEPEERLWERLLAAIGRRAA
ncbi:MAG TPA: tetraacyldisaccharide 4'-kinase [Vicinamibacteria bacterium]|nr:tetraacyldisaccharide 4'-kinase [Vicinamibacteria bacterium]